jgi:hypothetical protein
MSKKPKPSRVARHYFAETRDYGKVVDAESAFFRGLVAARNNIPSNPSLQKALSDVTGFLQDRGRPLDVLVEFSVADPHTKAEHTIMLGTLLKPPQHNSHAEATHFLCLADADSLLAKYHADFDFHPEATEKKPSPHVQIGGRVSDSLLKRYPKIWWNKDVNKPRLPALPICTALLWHWAFLEYQGDALMSAFLKNRWWNKLIKDAEGAVLSPFFEDGFRLMKYDPQKGLFNALYVPTPM